jgi:hypothetical protein
MTEADQFHWNWEPAEIQRELAYSALAAIGSCHHEVQVGFAAERFGQRDRRKDRQTGWCRWKFETEWRGLPNRPVASLPNEAAVSPVERCLVERGLVAIAVAQLFQRGLVGRRRDRPKWGATVQWVGI